MWIATASRVVHKRIIKIEDFVKLGDQLDRARDLHNQAMKKVKTGTGNVVGRIEKMKTLGLKTKKQLPESMKDHDE